MSILKSAGNTNGSSRTHLAFFQSEVLALARQCDTLTAKKPTEAALHKSRVLDLWALIPCFCRNPADLESTFPALAQILVRAMGDKRYPELIVSIAGPRTLSIAKRLIRTLTLSFFAPNYRLSFAGDWRRLSKVFKAEQLNSRSSLKERRLRNVDEKLKLLRLFLRSSFLPCSNLLTHCILRKRAGSKIWRLMKFRSTNLRITRSARHFHKYRLSHRQLPLWHAWHHKLFCRLSSRKLFSDCLKPRSRRRTCQTRYALCSVFRRRL